MTAAQLHDDNRMTALLSSGGGCHLKGEKLLGGC